ncbi:MAG: DEAD/DEAH box helicase [Candidatus Heimdallarchaeaceae archaeon]
MKFQDYKIKKEIKQALAEMGIETPTDIQEKAIPVILEGENTHIMAQARTGSGKTLAFSIPLAEELDPSLHEVQAVILVPTRELCKQVYHVISKVVKYRHLKATEVYGVIDLFQRRAISFQEVRYVVLDEADRMLDMGFLPDVDYILFEAMKNVYPRLLLFSATLLQEVKDIIEDYSLEENIVEIDVSKDDLTVSSCKQFYYEIEDEKQKYNRFVKILQRENPKSCIIFVNTKRWGNSLKNRLIKDKRLHYRIGLLQGDMSQKQREITMRDFRKNKINFYP